MLEILLSPCMFKKHAYNSPSRFREHICYVQACLVNTFEWFPSVFSEKFANYEAFCYMRIRIEKLNIKITKQKKSLKIISIHAEILNHY
jgi:hypothetical protein